MAIHTTLLEDLYVVLAYWEDGGQLASFKAIVNPLVVWIWIGAGVLMLGTLVAVWPTPQRLPSEQRQPSQGVAERMVRSGAAATGSTERSVARSQERGP